MRTERIHFRVASSLLGLLVLLASAAQAGGPLLIQNVATRTPYAYASPVNMYTDLGTLGAMTNAQANIITGNAAATWTAVPTSAFSAVVAGTVALIGRADITLANVATVIGVDNTGNGITVIYDTDGTIITNFLGAPPGVLGVASPEFALGATLTESWMVMNGAAIVPGDLPAGNSFAGVFTHEMGHAINLAHTQTNGGIIFFGDTRAPDACTAPYPTGLTLAATETMYPFIDPSPGSTGVQQATVDILDDVASLSKIYPAAGYPASAGIIEGIVYRPDGVTQITGVNVIARNLANPFLNGTSALSGDYTQGAAGADGRFRLTGLTPGASYVLYVDTIEQGGYSTTPVIPLPGPEEFWNAGETNNSIQDPPCDFTAIVVAAGQTNTANIQLNSAGLPPVIDVTPASIDLTVAPGSVTNVPLIISNVAAAGGIALNWTIDDVQASIATPLVPGDDLPADGHSMVSLDEPVALDARDQRLLRQCAGCGKEHAEHRTPLGMDVLPKAPGEIVDGSFELGPFGGAWTEFSSNFGTPLCDAAGCGTGGLLGARTGTYWCWFGGIATAETGSVSQNVIFPNGGTLLLEFYLDMGGCDSTNDFMTVRIDGTPVYTITGAAGNCASVGYELVSIDVSSLADGASHTVEFFSQVFATNTGVTNFFVDDIALVNLQTPCAWLSASPTNGSTPQGGSSNVDLQIDATSLSPGTYSCELQISSNDPANPILTVPVLVTVEQASPLFDVFVTTTLQGPVAVFAPPSGNGNPLNAAQQWSGVPGDQPATVDATITVQLLNSVSGAPVVGYQGDYIGLQAEFGGWVQCANTPLTADGPTDANGVTTISGVLRAGGSSAPGENLQVVVSDPNVASIVYPGGASGLPIRVNSADFSGDGAVDLVDVGSFAGIFAGAYDFGADYVWDGLVNLADIGQFSIEIGLGCPTLWVTTGPASSIDVVGVYFDAEGTSAARALAPGEVADAFVLLRGSSAVAGIDAWDLQLHVSENVVIEGRTLLGTALDFGKGDNHVVGLGQTRRAGKGDVLQLMHVRLSVRDERPAYLWIGPSDRSKLELPAVAREGAVHTAMPVSGSVDLPVASLNDADFDGGGVVTPHRALSLSAAPNPFNPSTEIRFAVPAGGPVELRILDVRGQLVTVLRNEVVAAGEHMVVWNGTDRTGRTVGSGVYYATLVTGEGERTKKLLLVK